MSTENQRYADQLTLRAYSARLNRPRIKPSDRPSLRDTNEGEFDFDCLGFCVSNYTISTLLCYTTDKSEDGKCVTMNVRGTYEEIEETKCMDRQAVDLYVAPIGYDLINDGPYIVSDTFWSINGNGKECMDSTYSSLSVVGRCQHADCVDGNPRRPQFGISRSEDRNCLSSKTYSYERSWTTCADVPNRRLASGKRKPQLDFPALLPETLDYRVNGFRTAWITSQVMNDIIGRGGYKLGLSTDCKCVEGTPRVAGTVVGNLLPPEETGLSGRSVINLGNNTSDPSAPTDRPNTPSTRSRNTSSGSSSTPPSSGSSSTPPSSGSSSTSSGSSY